MHRSIAKRASTYIFVINNPNRMKQTAFNVKCNLDVKPNEKTYAVLIPKGSYLIFPFLLVRFKRDKCET